MTFRELFKKAQKAKRPTIPATAFLQQAAAATGKSVSAVRKWARGDTVPDTLTKEALAKHFNSTPEQLFPKR